jgi:hypothetical protein
MSWRTPFAVSSIVIWTEEFPEKAACGMSFGLGKLGVLESWIKLWCDEFHYLYHYPYIISMIKEDEVGDHVKCMKIREMHVDILWGHVKEEDLLQDPYVNGRITLKLPSKKLDWETFNWILLTQNRDEVMQIRLL